ncbi:hypothetical protein QCA50_010263 [Cerrena zonata]|uniref:Uncharacterized protein n=1 Tax=Cerrena zonata TaxID=2478898 RepID=A0AAW0FYS1_9APHY
MSANGTTMLRLTMPVHQDVIDRLYEHCVTQKLYNKRKKRWTGMPRSTSLPETAMYQPIQAIGQCIHDACQNGSSVKVDGKSLKEVQHGNDRVETVNGIWNVLPNRAPRTQDSFTSDTRPDIDFSMDSKQRVELSAEIDKYLEALRERSDESKMKIPMVGATEDEMTGDEASTDEDEDETHEEMRPEDESSEDENGTTDQNEETAAKEYIKAKEAQLNEAMQR